MIWTGITSRKYNPIRPALSIKIDSRGMGVDRAVFAPAARQGSAPVQVVNAILCMASTDCARRLYCQQTAIYARIHEKWTIEIIRRSNTVKGFQIHRAASSM